MLKQLRLDVKMQIKTQEQLHVDVISGFYTLQTCISEQLSLCNNVFQITGALATLANTVPALWIHRPVTDVNANKDFMGLFASMVSM